jgi:hypothetical protein
VISQSGDGMSSIDDSKTEDKNIKEKRVITGIPLVIITVAAVAGIVYQLWNAGF